MATAVGGVLSVIVTQFLLIRGRIRVRVIVYTIPTTIVIHGNMCIPSSILSIFRPGIARQGRRISKTAFCCFCFCVGVYVWFMVVYGYEGGACVRWMVRWIY